MLDPAPFPINLNGAPSRPSISRETPQEADHRIANSLMLVGSFLRLRGREIAKRPLLTGTEAKGLLEDAAASIHAVSQLHRLLSAAPHAESCDPCAYLRSVGDVATKISQGSPITLHYNLADNLKLDGRRTMSLGLLAAEAIINAMKHAHPTGVAGEIRMSFRQLGADGVLVIEDDGVGLPDGFDAATDGGVGFRSMRQFAEQLNARLTHRSTPLGLRTEVVFAL